MGKASRRRKHTGVMGNGGAGRAHGVPRAGVGPAPDGMPQSVWREAGAAGLFYLGRDSNGEWRFTLSPDVSLALRSVFPDLYSGLA